ncbi:MULTISPECIES: LTA synthase family protein [Rubrivivax]|uniref:LTA synthase family protein n=1 Tax=Rubrivivax benzoatilyticus TaxID=316997 RepID=A0ABX0HXB5_9BURK|nr:MULTISPECIES: LTA synthase family protein [Rubrivivax]NHK98019.1 LTA synthase family protein [Rubrivivax benzoatilyticus]NHL23521.1 LTA synthase family protein [Rubrivivax benzoatilyticus]
MSELQRGPEPPRSTADSPPPAASARWLAALRWLAGPAAAAACAYSAVHWADLFAMRWPQRHLWLFSARDTLAWEVDLLNALFGLTLYALARLVFTPLAAALTAITLLGTVAVVSARKMLELDMPLLPWDLWFVGNLADFAAFLGWSLAAVAALAAAAAAVLLVLAWRWRHAVFRRRRGIARSAVAAAGLVGVCAWGVVLPPTPRGLSGQVHNITWDQGANFANFGPYYAFAVNLPFIGIPRPAADDLAAARALDAAASPAAGPGGERPDIVLLLSESFTRLPEQLFGKPYGCLAAAPESRLVSPAWGGFTANVEFELLTGYPYAMLPPGSVPFQMYLSRPVVSALPRVLRDRGWRTQAVHTFHRDFFSRPQAYAALGIDDYAGLEDLPGAARRGQYVDDRVLFDQILKRLDAPGAEPRLVHAVSMMAHLPYDWEGRFPLEPGLAARLPAGLDDDALALTQYASMLYDHERAFCGFLEQLKSRPRRTLVLFYGDHYPSFGSLAVYERLNRVLHGADAPLNLERDFSKPPLALFDSRDGFVTLPDEVAAYNLGALVLQQAGLAAPGHWAMPHKRDRVTLVRRLYVAANQSSGSLAAAAAGTDSPELRTLRAHAWRHLFGPAVADDDQAAGSR